MEQSHMTKKIINFTLEILYLLTGEHYGPIKTFGSILTPGSHAQFSGEQNRSQSIIMQPPPPSLTVARDSVKKILEVTQKIIELLTGEDVSVYSSMEEWEYLEGHRDLYKDVMMENRPPLTSPDGSSKRNPPERCPHPLYSQDSTQEHKEIPQARPLYSGECTKEHQEILQTHPLCSAEPTEEHQEIPQEDQGAYQSAVQTQVKEEAEDPSMRHVEPCKEEEIPPEISTDSRDTRLIKRDIKAEEEEHVKIKDEEIPLEISTGSNGETVFAHWASQEPSAPVALLLSHPFIWSYPTRSSSIGAGPGNGTVTQGNIKVKKAKERPVKIKEEEVLPEVSTDGQEHPVRAKLHIGVRKGGLSSVDPMVVERLQGQPHHLTRPEGCIIPKKFPCSECGKYFTDKAKVAVHQRLHTGERPFFCSQCGKRFTRNYSLREHQQRAHGGEGLFSCPKCENSFTRKADLLRHQTTHTEERTFKCSRCDKCFLRKSCLARHEKTHRGDILYT